MKRLCICEICNCGRHRCPYKPTALYCKSRTTNAGTEYTEKYPGYGSCLPTRSFKPENNLKGFKGKMESTTTVQADFIPHEVGAPPEKRRVPYQPKPGTIDLNTTYKVHYKLYNAEPVGPVLPRSRGLIGTGKMDAMTTYKDNFRKWLQSRRELLKPDMSYHPPPVKFGNLTTSQDDFFPKKIEIQRSLRPPNAINLSDAPFSGLTTNNLSYLPPKLEPRYFKTPMKYKPSNQPFQDATTYRHYHRGLEGERSRSCKPEHGKLGSDAPIQSSTEFRDQFKVWPVLLPPARKGIKYSLPTQKMDMSTTTNDAYIKYKAHPVKPIVPVSSMVLSSGPFYGLTTMKDDFRIWDGKRRELIHKLDEIPRAKGKMEDLTTFRAHFVQKPLQPIISYKPIAAPRRTDAILEDDTTYRTEFSLKKINLCPARFKYPPGFVFEEVNDRGHRLFRKVTEEQCCYDLAPNNVPVKCLEVK